MNIIKCHLCGDPCPEKRDRWWPEEDGTTCQDCWEMTEDLITAIDIESMKPAIELPPEDFHVPSHFFLLGEDYDFLNTECAEEPSG